MLFAIARRFFRPSSPPSLSTSIFDGLRGAICFGNFLRSVAWRDCAGPCSMQAASGFPQHPHAHWIANWIEQKANIAARTASPRIVIAGGSNAFYGLSAKRISKRSACARSITRLMAGCSSTTISTSCVRFSVRVTC